MQHPISGPAHLPQHPAHWAGPVGWSAQGFPAAPPSVVDASTEQRVQLMEMWHSVLRRKSIIIGLGLITGLVAWIIASGAPPQYSASAKLLIETPKTRIASVEDLFAGGGRGTAELLQTQIQIFLSRDNALRTAKELKLWEYPELDARVPPPPTMLDKLLTALGSTPKRPTGKFSDEQLAEVAAARLRGGLSATVVQGSRLITVSYTSHDRTLPPKIANAAAEQYIASEAQARNRMTQGFTQQMEEQLVSLREKVDQSAKLLQEFRERNPGVVSSQARSGTGSQTAVSAALPPSLSTVARLSELRSKRLELERALVYAKSASSPASPSKNQLLRESALAEVTRAVREAERRLVDLESTPNVELKKLARARADVAEAKAELQQRQAMLTAVAQEEFKERQQAEVTALERQLDVLKQQEGLIERELAATKVEAREDSRQEMELQRLERDHQLNRQFYEQLLARKKEFGLSADLQGEVGRIVEYAQQPDSAMSASRERPAITAALAAMVLAAAISIMLDRMDSSIKTTEDAEARLKQPVLASLPAVERLSATRMARMVLDSPHSLYSEAIRTARTGILLSHLDTKNKIILVTSSVPGEGKTTAALNLAFAHSKAKRTLLIDCDMRRSQVSQALNLPPGSLGLSNLAAGTADQASCIYLIPETELYVLPVGDIPPNPLELLHSNRFQETLVSLSESFDIIIIDSPPVELVSEALVLAPMATCTVFVVKAVSTAAPLVRKSMMRLQRGGASILGVLLNQVDPKHSAVYYGEIEYSEYGYGGGKSYGATASKKDPSAIEDVVIDGDLKPQTAQRRPRWFLRSKEDKADFTA